MGESDEPEAVLLRRPAGDRKLPLVFDSPHSGRSYPADFEPLVPVEQLRGFEDRLVDDLITDAPDLGITLLAAGFPRAYVDPNRAADDLDRLIAGEDWDEPISPTVNAERGIGLVFRVSLDGSPLYERPLSRDRLRARIHRYWRPYHEALASELDRCRDRWGAVWHVSWHSMRPIGNDLAPDPGETRPDFVVSDLDGGSAEPEFTRAAVEALQALGYSVALNRPFKGGYITRLHGSPHEARHSLQIEINRKLYLDLATLEPLPEAEALRSRLAELSSRLARYVADRAGISAS